MIQSHNDIIRDAGSLCLCLYCSQEIFRIYKMAAAVQMSLVDMTVSTVEKIELLLTFQGLLLKNMKTLLRRLPEDSSLIDQN